MKSKIPNKASVKGKRLKFIALLRLRRDLKSFSKKGKHRRMKKKI